MMRHAIHWRYERGCAPRGQPLRVSAAGRFVAQFALNSRGHQGDNRHWPDIEAWAKGIAQGVQAESTVHSF